MDKTEINKTENEYISKHLAPLIEKGIITDVREGEDSKIFFILTQNIERYIVTCRLELRTDLHRCRFCLWRNFGDVDERKVLMWKDLLLEPPGSLIGYDIYLEVMIENVVREFKEVLMELKAEEE